MIVAATVVRALRIFSVVPAHTGNKIVYSCLEGSSGISIHVFTVCEYKWGDDVNGLSVTNLQILRNTQKPKDKGSLLLRTLQIPRNWYCSATHVCRMMSSNNSSLELCESVFEIRQKAVSNCYLKKHISNRLLTLKPPHCEPHGSIPDLQARGAGRFLPDTAFWERRHFKTVQKSWAVLHLCWN